MGVKIKDTKFEIINEHWKNLISEILDLRAPDNIQLRIIIPFCGQQCTYCDHFIRRLDLKLINDHVNLVIEQMKDFSLTFSNYEFRDVFIGGGSSSALGIKNIRKIFKAIRKYFKINENANIIIEGDFIFLNEIIIKEFKKQKTTLFSIGIQTTNSSILNRYKRIQSNNKILEVNSLLNKYLIPVNYDLIVGLKNDNLNSLKKSIDFTYSLKPDSITVYKYNSTSIYQNSSLFNILGNEDSNMEFVKNIFSDKGIVISDIEYYTGEGTELLRYIDNKYENNTEYPLFTYLGSVRDSSILTLGFGQISSIFGKIEYSYLPESEMRYNDNRITNSMVYNNYLINKIDYKKSILFYIFKKFNIGYINLISFKRIFKINILDIAKEELTFLIKHNKMHIDKVNIIFDFKNKEEIAKYQYLLSKKS